MGVPSIGGFSLTELQGAINPMGTNIQKVTRSGVNGVAYRKIGDQPFPTSHNSISDHTTKGSAETAIANYLGLKGTLVTVLDPGGTSHTNIMVLQVIALAVKPVANAVGGVNAGSWVVFAEWTLESTTVP